PSDLTPSPPPAPGPPHRSPDPAAARLIPPPQRHGSSRRLSAPSQPAVAAIRSTPAAPAALERKHTMAERTVTIASKTGLHARPAGIFAKAAEQQPATVTIEKPGGNAVQASSMLMLMTLGAAQGDEVTLRAEGEGAEESVNALAELLEKDLDAQE